ncbi:MAG: hypothetical protein IPO65_06530 [Saprospiraceae bacterium]|nr:hypothetical protein [Saprospiraceae bacterium]
MISKLTHKIFFLSLFAMLFILSCKNNDDTDDPIVEEKNLTAHYNSNVVSEWINLYMDVEKTWQVSGLHLHPEL